MNLHNQGQNFSKHLPSALKINKGHLVQWVILSLTLCTSVNIKYWLYIKHHYADRLTLSQWHVSKSLTIQSPHSKVFNWSFCNLLGQTSQVTPNYKKRLLFRELLCSETFVASLSPTFPVLSPLSVINYFLKKKIIKANATNYGCKVIPTCPSLVCINNPEESDYARLKYESKMDHYTKY